MAVKFSKWPSDDTRIIVRRLGEYVGCIRKGKNGWLPSIALSAAMNGTDDNRSKTVWRNRHVATDRGRRGSGAGLAERSGGCCPDRHRGPRRHEMPPQIC